MDGETERKLAALILAEAERLRAQAESDGIRAYIKPKTRHRPSSQFLRATMQGVDSRNRGLQIRDMWESRERELEREKSARGNDFGRRTEGITEGIFPKERERSVTVCKKERDGMRRERTPEATMAEKYSHFGTERELRGGATFFGQSAGERHGRVGKDADHFEPLNQDVADSAGRGTDPVFEGNGSRNRGTIHREKRASAQPVDNPIRTFEKATGSPSAEDTAIPLLQEGGIPNTELKSFLLSRRKRGRGAVGSHMDEGGPYAQSAGGQAVLEGPTGNVVGLLLDRVREEWEERVGSLGSGKWAQAFWPRGEEIGTRDYGRGNLWGDMEVGEAVSGSSSSDEEEKEDRRREKKRRRRHDDKDCGSNKEDKERKHRSQRRKKGEGKKHQRRKH